MIRQNIVLSSLVLSLFSADVAAQTSVMYLSEYCGTQAMSVQGGAVVNTWSSVGPTENATAVVDTVRSMSGKSGQTGREYDLSGVPTGTTYMNPGFRDCYDGATDVTDFNWTIDHNGAWDVIRFDRDWGGGGVIVFKPTRRSSGITYDSLSGTLWTTSTVGTATHLQNYTTAGVFIAEYPVNVRGGYALAWDPADDTLWIPESFGTPGQLHQFDKSGNLLQIVSIPGLSWNAFGAEFPMGGAAAIRTVDATPASVAPGQTGAAVSFVAENIGPNLLNVTGTDLTFVDSMMNDVSSEYTVTPAPGNPTTIPVAGMETFSFTVDVNIMATLGTITVDGTIMVTDTVAMTSSQDTAADTPDSWDVLGALPMVRVVDAPADQVSQGRGGYAVSTTVENVGLNAVNVTQAGLTFTDTGMIDRSSDYVVTPDPGNPTSIAASATETFLFSVDVDPAATTGDITIDGNIDATDAVSMAMSSDADADVTDVWEVLTCLTTFCGDCNGDMMVTILDALLAAQHSAALITLTGVSFTNCNVIGLVEPDPGAVVAILDALILAQFAAGLPVTLSCC